MTLGGDVTGVAIGSSPGILTGKVDLGQNNRNFFALDATTASGTTFGLDVDAVISSASGAFGITKMGAGTVNFEGTAANTYTGTTTVNEGTLLLSSRPKRSILPAPQQAAVSPWPIMVLRQPFHLAVWPPRCKPISKMPSIRWGQSARATPS